MEYRNLGATDLRVSAVGFGGWPMGGTQVVDGYGGAAEDEVIAAVQRALDLGITCFDTAYAYGLGYGEELMAKALGPRRKDVVLVTKVGIYFDEATGKWRRDSRYATVVESVEGSLRRLKTECIDLYLVHWPDTETPFEEPMRAMSDLIAAGKIRYAGVSNFSAAQIAECLKTTRLAANQVGLNMFDRRWEPELLPYCQRQGIGIMAYGPLAHGLLTGTFTRQTTFDAKDWRAGGTIFGLPLFKGENFQKNLAVVERLKALAAERDKTLPQLAIAWVLRHEVVTVALVGARKPSEIEENVGAADWRLTAEDLAAVDEILKDAAGTTPA